MSKQGYAYNLSIGRAPSLKELILCRTYMHDHLLNDPEKIRKFLDKHIEQKLLKSSYDDFLDYAGHETSRGMSSEIFKTLTNNRKVEMYRYDSYKEARGNANCCYTQHELFIGLQVDPVPSIRQMWVVSEGCGEYPGCHRYKSIEKCDIYEFEKMDIKTFLTKYPEFILDTDPYEHADILIKAIEPNDPKPDDPKPDDPEPHA